MTSIVGLPTQGSDVTILITKVHLHPLCVLVEFWGKFNQQKTGAYECLAKDIQSPGEIFQQFEGNSGDQCLVQIDGTWYRSRIVSRHGSKYSVFLIDKGVTFNTSSSELAWGQKKHFCLPPEVEFCVLANVLPLSAENRWSSVALEFLRSLSGKSVKAHVQDVLLLHRAFVLHIPCISKQMYEMGIAKKMSPDIFQDFVLKTLQSHSGAEVSAATGLTSEGEGERLHKKEIFMYPELQAGTVETVTVTDVTNPHRIFCQLKVFSQELRKLSERITQCCEGRKTTCLVGPDIIGFPCAARGSDGRWYRSVLQQVLPTNQVVEVLNVDYGTKQFVQVENVRPLATDFFRMPVVTYMCSLHGIVDNGVGWTASQVDYLKTLLLNKTMIAKFEYQSISEGVYYVTLYGDENTNINKLFASNMSCSLESDKMLGDYAIRNVPSRRQHPPQQDRSERKMSEKEEGKGVVEKLPTEDLSLNSSHVAVIQHVSDPSEFWIQTQNYANELDEIMDRIHYLYKDSVNTDVRNPTVGLYCASKAEDGDFYRAAVTEVGETKVKVFFVDYGNTEDVDRSNIRMLPDEFKKLPRLALKCTLAGIRPKGQKWSESACEVFIKATEDKALNLHVSGKYDMCYVVQLADPEAQGERDLAALMCSSGHAESAETQRQPKVKMPVQTAGLPTGQLPDASLSGAHINHGTSFQTQNAVNVAGNQRRPPAFKEHMFPTGSVLDVSVSYIESPNDFWCQLVQNAGLLKLLMYDIQAYYQGSEFEPPVETTCVARHPDNRKWYRALVIHKHETPHVDVLFVDYGQTETVSLYDLRRICPQFLALHGQAFRCSLMNPVDPTSATNEWNEEATAKFHTFVETASSNFVTLKCTIYAVMYSEQKIVFNIVDLETPFESVSTSMVNLLKSASPKKEAGLSFRLDTYYYSTHNVKTGTEEQVTVTCVNDVSKFYCQLERNAEVTNDLKIKVNNLCHQLENVKLPTDFGALCFAKYTDGQWYRGQIKATRPAIFVHFVDYGDTIEVEKSDLLPVPREANDIMSVPVQALVCSLSDVPADVPSEMNSWFETSVTDCKFRALVVAREPDGKLQVELYHGNTQINSKIKKMFQIEVHPETMVVHQSCAKPVRKWRDADKIVPSEPKPSRNHCENGQKDKGAPLKLYQPPHQRKPWERTQRTRNGSEPAAAKIKPRKTSPPTETKQLVKSTPSATESQKESNVENLPQLADLPPKSITSGMTAEVYVSQCNSPLSFYVQLVSEEDEIISLVEKLNDPKCIPQSDSIKDVQPGDLVQAEFAEDSSWYRAVVREIYSTAIALVEFVDFGNTAIVPVSKLSKLQKSFLELPMYSTHCMLSNVATLGDEKVLDPEVVSAFKEDISGIGTKVLKCTFSSQSGSVWEVSLEDSGVNLTCKMPSSFSTDGPERNLGRDEQTEGKPAQNPDIRSVPEDSQISLKSCSLCYPQREFSEGQTLEVYISSTNDDKTFWCQPADSEELDKITISVTEVGEAVVKKDLDPAAFPLGSPCIAQFADDNLWYRAEVISKEENELFVSFVDYGNKSKVSVSDVREIPQDLIKSPPQAFLCKLEGLGASNGTWDSSAVDELSVLTANKALQLTVTRVTSEEEEGKITCFVQIICEGQIMNEALKTWWRPSMAEKKPDEVEVTDSYRRSPPCDPTVEETAPLDNQSEHQSQEMEASVPCSHPPGDHSDEQSAEEYVHSQSLEVSAEEGDTKGCEPQILIKTESLSLSKEEVSTITTMAVSETKPTDVLTCDDGIEETMFPPQTDKDTEEKVSFGPDDINSLLCEKPAEDINESGIIMDDLQSLPGEVDTYSIESSLDKTVLYPEMNTSTEEEFGSMLDTLGLDDIKYVSDENLTEADESGITETVLEFLLEEVHTQSMESSFDTMTFSAPPEEKDRDVSDSRESSLTSTTTVKMVPREAVWPNESLSLFENTDLTSDDLKQNRTEVALPSCGLPASDIQSEQESEPEGGVLKEQVSCLTTDDKNDLMTEVENTAHHEDMFSDIQSEQESEPEGGVLKEQVSCVTTDDKNDLMTEVENTAHHEDMFSGLPSDTNEASIVEHPCTASSNDVDAEVLELTCSVEEACLTDVCTDHNESSDREVPSAGEDRLSCVTADETVQSESLLSSTELHCEQSAEALTENEIQVQDVSLQNETSFIKSLFQNTSISEDETEALQEDQLSALPSDSEPQVCTIPFPDLNNLVEEVTCLVGEICLTDVCRDPHKETETEDREQLVQTSPEQKEDFSAGVLEEEVSSSDDSFEEQLSKITHLSLKINDGSADLLPVVQQSEE
ncbi:tudor domain-containing protein 6 [Notolabrus celidotus]|uniref:tudor domain-containing protein 6 n=1 Tax=Notolabrus celidotus TaxID=1203425 RepID=UPI00148FE22F|nr:tudor domain-containing protein 6 [Notolabrus celidotus]XP_034554940.1 tudor domain-containing protein 6 [Notolabrus celidotus]XP_034554941.1 tudor domain-containing protein 6 [Notolabrus celidotus]